MYGPSAAEVEEFIRFGAPREWLEDPDARARLDQQLIRMPAYGELLDDHQIDDLVQFVTALEGIGLPEGPESVLDGRRLARQHGCTSCHGVAGAGGISNPRSLGGFVPGFVGRNFEHLVADHAEFSEWVGTGSLRRLESNPLVTFFWRRQKLRMPAYEEILSPSEVDAIWQWIQFLRTPPDQNDSPTNETATDPPAAS